MRIAITHPTTYDRVRRGTERWAHEVARWLGHAGHDVRVIACKPGPREVVAKEGYVQDSHRRLWHPALARVGIIEAYSFLPSVALELLRGRYDVVQCCSLTDAVAAVLTRRLTGAPCIFTVNAMQPPVRYFRAASTGGALFRYAVREADEVHCLSGFMHRYVHDRFGRDGTTMHLPVDTDFFRYEGRRSNPAVILCAAALDDARKGGDVLMRAFNIVKRARPDVQLHNSSAISAATRRHLLDIVDPCFRADVRFLGEGRREDLPRLYGQATVSVLASRWEAYGLVMLESMACGTPVVAADHGAVPELVDDERVGRTFDSGREHGIAPTDERALAAALLEGLALGEQAETAAHCRARAERSSWQALGPGFVRFYEEVAARRPAGRG